MLIASVSLVAVCGCSPRVLVTQATGESFELDAATPESGFDVVFCYDGRPLSWVDGPFARLSFDVDSAAELGGLSLEVMVDDEEEPRALELGSDPSTLLEIDEAIFEAGGCTDPVALTLTLQGDPGGERVTLTPVLSVDMEYIIDGGSFFALSDTALEIRFEQ